MCSSIEILVRKPSNLVGKSLEMVTATQDHRSNPIYNTAIRHSITPKENGNTTNAG
ncbi:hypothetical protein BVRB_9g212600 [Beta vulgaris subsp. vulgaris]|nr:hypothetical protein BVRB_9g212600 [Beta vulgaris subsp. vulgaris]